MTTSPHPVDVEPYTEVLDVMGPRTPAWDLDKPTPTLTYVDARQVHLTVNHTTVAPPSPCSPCGDLSGTHPKQLEAPADPTPVASISVPPRCTEVDRQDATAMLCLTVVIILLGSVLLSAPLLGASF